MRTRITLLAALAALAALTIPALATGVAAASPSPSAASSKAATVSVRTTKLGRVLVDAQGRTLYLFEKDKGDKSACAGACAAGWPPLMASGKLKAGHGVEGKLLGTTVRKAGTQVTYAGHPLYAFAGDSRPGQTNGEGSTAFGAAWYVLAPSGHRIAKS
jgi:predicted lipoprotein with Yx(FWY)xxD motif